MGCGLGLAWLLCSLGLSICAVEREREGERLVSSAGSEGLLCFACVSFGRPDAQQLIELAVLSRSPGSGSPPSTTCGWDGGDVGG